jgi:large subunit ribosomal protein L19
MQGLQAILHQVEAKYLRTDTPEFNSGDSVKVHVKVREGEKERIQIFEGTVIGRGKDGTRETFRVRRIASGVGVERLFAINSPNVVKIQVTKFGTTRKARLYYLKGKSGKDARIAERRREEPAAGAAKPATPSSTVAPAAPAVAAAEAK